MKTETDGVTDRERGMELPVAVGQGVLRLFLLEELRDGQQLFQHMLQTHRGGEYCIIQQILRNGQNCSVNTMGLLQRCSVLAAQTCCAPLSLLKVRSSSEWATQISCRAARSRDRSVLKCSGASGKSGTFWRTQEEKHYSLKFVV